jgi:hypothetical protein
MAAIAAAARAAPAVCEQFTDVDFKARGVTVTDPIPNRGGKGCVA